MKMKISRQAFSKKEAFLAIELSRRDPSCLNRQQINMTIPVINKICDK